MRLNETYSLVKSHGRNRETVLVGRFAGGAPAEGVPDGRERSADPPSGTERGPRAIAEDWAWIDAIGGTFSDDFFAEGRRQPDQQKRPELDTLIT